MYSGLLLGHPLMSECKRFLTRHKPLTHRQWLDRIEQTKEFNLTADFFNSGPTIDALEQRMAKLLGKESALFVPKGMMGQNSALLQWASQTNRQKIAIHPQSHIHVDEELAYKELMGLDAVMFGQENQAITKTDIDALPTDLSTITIEIPTRRAGFKLPDWQDLLYLKSFSQQHQIPIHIDGARLLEASYYWEKSYKEVAAIGDSVYVSLYKTLGAAAGGIIAGDKSFIDQLIPWRTRFGGDLFTAFPYVLTALWGLENYLPRISEFHQRALSLSNLIKAKLGNDAIPNPVQCNGFIVQLPINADLLEERALSLAKERKIWLFDRIYNVGEDTSQFEIQVGDALDDWEDEELVLELLKLVS